MVSPERSFFGLIELSEVAWKRSQLMKVSVRTDQQIFSLRIESREVANQIPNVCAYPEFIYLVNVDGDAHEINGKSSITRYNRGNFQTVS